MMFVLLCIAGCLVGALAQPTVEIGDGTVIGRAVNTHYDVTVNSFLGIPFAEAPDGPNRFEEPRPVGNFQEFEANTLGTACMQSPVGWLWLTHPGWSRYEEDCLNLNVFTPENMDPAEPYAVMVYFYGGGYESGGNVQYPGHFLAARDVVLVVPNYRVGIFGFLTTGDATNPGNYGLYDQRLALEWVQTNIRAFGGDPDRVTIFGQSAGASSSSLHVTSPGSAGLFNQMIGQSGTDMNFWTINWPAQQPETYVQQAALRVGCEIDNDQTMVNCLKQVDAWELRNNSWVDCTPGHFCQGHAPVIDGEFIPDYPNDMRRRGEFYPANTMSGWNSDDGSLYTYFMIPESMDGGINRTMWQKYLDERLIGMWEEQFPEDMYQDALAAFDWFYTPWPYLDDNDLNLDAYNMLITDGAFGYASEKQLKYQYDVADTYQYIFGYRSARANWTGTDWVGVPHSGEVPYIFGWPLLQLSPQVRANSRILIDFVDWDDVDIEYAEFMSDLWTNFAKFGNPTPEPLDTPRDYGQVQFQPFSPDEMNYAHIFGDRIENDINYRVQENAFFSEYMSYILDRELFGVDDKWDKATAKKPTGKSRLNSLMFQDGIEDYVQNILDSAGIEYDY